MDKLSVKVKSSSGFQNIQRFVALRRSKEFRSELLDQLRQIALQTHLSGETKTETARNLYKCAEDAEIDVDIDTLSTNKKSKVTKASMRIAHYFAQQLIHYDHFIEPPFDLKDNWFCIARPEGSRALIVANHGYVTHRNKNGRFKEHFAARHLPKELTILDCVFDEARQLFWVIDCMMWNGMPLANSDIECRRHLIESKFQGDQGEMLATPNGSSQRYGFKLVNLYTCTLENLMTLYFEERKLDVDYNRDSLLFIHKEARYSAPWSPLFVQFKDSHLSLYAIDTEDKGGEAGEDHFAVLKLHNNGLLMTLDLVPLGYLSPKEMRERKIRPGQCIKCKIPANGFVKELHEKELLMELETKQGIEEDCEKSHPEIDDVSDDTFSDTLESLPNKKENKNKNPPIFGALGYKLVFPLEVISLISKVRVTPEPFSRILSQHLLRNEDGLEFVTVVNSICQ